MSSQNTSEGTQEVIDDIAGRRRRLHFLKDRRASQERFEKREPVDRRASYRAWGRTPSGVLADSLMVPKEINLLWGWYSPVMHVTSKFDLVDVDTLLDQLIMVCMFENYEQTEEFMKSVQNDKEGYVSFAEITAAIANSDVSTLRQFAKKLKQIKKEKKKIPASSKSITNMDSSGQPGWMSKAKSEKHLGGGIFPKLNLSSLSTDEDPPHSTLPLIRPSSSVRRQTNEVFPPPPNPIRQVILVFL
jgi:hypothetical protein